MEYEFIRKQDYALGYVQENIEMIIYSAVCFFVPFFIGHPQIVVGIIVNAALFMAALNLRSAKILPVIFMPSLGVLAKGMIFGPLSIYLIYMIPFIWIGNALLVLLVKKIMKSGIKAKISAIAFPSIAKASFLFISAFVLYSFGVIPVIFLTAMGIIQLITAISGGILGFSIHSMKKYSAKHF